MPSSELQSKLRTLGLADREVRHTVTADIVHVWNDDRIGLSMIFGRNEEVHLQLATRSGDSYSIYRCDFAEMTPAHIEQAVDAIQRREYLETENVEVTLGEGDGHLRFKARG